MHVEWKVYESSGRKVEAQIWSPDRPTSKAILFCPGFPGVGAGLFEQRHAASLAHEGFNLIVLRHMGTRLDTPSAPLMINNGLRLMQARQRGETMLGGAVSCVADWLLEPLPALQVITDEFSDIYVIGNSFGAVSALWSLTEEGARLDKVRSILLYAGAQSVVEDGGVMDVMRIWRPEFLEMPRVTSRAALGDARENVKVLEKAYRDLPGRVKARLPEHIPLTALVVANDEILKLWDARKFQDAIGGRGKIVIDEIDKASPEHLLLAHDTPDYPTENILELLK